VAFGVEQHVALPALVGAPAYSRPPRPVSPTPRPVDLDDLPLEAEMTEDERRMLAEAGWSVPLALPSALPTRDMVAARRVASGG
jgi:hypothetical protein